MKYSRSTFPLFVLLCLTGLSLAVIGATATLAGDSAIIGKTVAGGVAPGGRINHDRAAKIRKIKQVASSGPFAPNWDSLAKYEIPQWYQDAKFGIFIHWGAYSVPAFNGEWYPRWMYSADNENHSDYYPYHVEKYGPVDQFGYKDFIPLFKAEKFNARQWAKLFKDAGAKYVIPVAEHHDGFAMYDSQYTRWNAAKMGPKRDIIGELSKAIRAEGLAFGVSSHRAENWWFFGEGRKLASDVQDEQYRDLYGPARDRDESESGVTPPTQEFLDDWLLRCAELVDNYQPDIIWFDWWIAQKPFHENLQQFSAYYYNRGKTWDHMVAINYKELHGDKSYPDTAGVLDVERGGLADIRQHYWQTDTSVSKSSWGYVTNHQYKQVNSLIDDLVDIVSKNGCMLLNIGPKPDGTIPEHEAKMLLEMGQWLSINGEAIYGTRPWTLFGEGPTHVIDGKHLNNAESSRKEFQAEDIRFTTKTGALYALLLDWPGNSAPIVIQSLTAKGFPHAVKRVTMLGSPGELTWSRSDQGLTVQLPEFPPCQHAQAIKIDYVCD